MAKKIAIVLVSIVLCFVVLFQVLKRVQKTVVIQHTLNAPVTKVWKLWNDPESIKKWWSPTGFIAPTVKNDLRVGGNYILSMKSGDQKTIWNVGTYTEIIPNQKIVSSMSFADEQGTKVPAEYYGVPGNWPDAVTVQVEFKDLGNNQTQVTVQESGIPMIMSLFAKMGWKQQFEKFEKLL